MTSLKPNLVKRVERLPKPTDVADAMQPLFEAISNAIHSTQAKFGDHVAKLGRVHVEVSTDRRKEDVWAVVEDNGVGLDAANWEAFTTTDTDNKIDIGGKGVGRLLWLDCFPEIEVTSVFDENGDRKERTFKFALSMENQITDHKVEDATPSASTGFRARFNGLKNNGYLAKFPGRKEYVFQHITSHFLPTFIGGRCPVMTVVVGDESRDYPQAIDEIVHRRDPVISIKTEEYGTLHLTMMECDKVASADLKGSHFVHFIAHDRTVHSQSIDGKLGLKYFGENGDRVFHAILTGEFLDSNVNQERTAFMFEDAVIERIIKDVCTPHIEKFLEGPLAQLSGTQRERIEAITESYPSVAFGDVEELQQKIPSGELNDDAIYGHLARERFRRDQRQAERVRSVLTRLKAGGVTADAFDQVVAEAGQAIEEAEQRSLAEYVVRRKVVLDFIEVLLQKVRADERDSSYQREDVLHSLICPMQVTTLASGKRRVDPSASHDLWIVDERLTFARYFSSDVEFSVLSEAIDSEDRADVLIFDYAHGLRQATDSPKVLMIELKRPGRTKYDDDENPHMQVERYVRRLLSGELRDVSGRPIKLDQNTVFHCFIVADIVGKLDEWTFTWQRTPDGRGRLYQPREGFKGSIELIGWDALLDDARQRNQAFFDRAGITGKSFFTIE
jgi:hypothetical protein